MSLSVTTSSVTQTSFTARVRTTGSVPMQHNWYLDGTLYTTIQTSQGETSSSCSFRGLNAGTSYRVSVRVFAFNPWRELDNGSANVTTKSSSSSGGGDDSGSSGGGDTKKRPNNWYWNSNVSRGAPLSLPASEWNQFIDRIREFASYKGVTLSSSYLSNATASSRGKMLASQANAAISLISQLNPPTSPPSRVYAGGAITASFFLDLRGSLNSIR